MKKILTMLNTVYEFFFSVPSILCYVVNTCSFQFFEAELIQKWYFLKSQIDSVWKHNGEIFCTG